MATHITDLERQLQDHQSATTANSSVEGYIQDVNLNLEEGAEAEDKSTRNTKPRQKNGIVNNGLTQTTDSLK